MGANLGSTVVRALFIVVSVRRVARGVWKAVAAATRRRYCMRNNATYCGARLSMAAGERRQPVLVQA